MNLINLISAYYLFCWLFWYISKYSRCYRFWVQIWVKQGLALSWCVFTVCVHDFNQEDCSDVYKPGTFRRKIFSSWYFGSIIFLIFQQFFNEFRKQKEKVAKQFNRDRESNPVFVPYSIFITTHSPLVYFSYFLQDIFCGWNVIIH